MSKKKEKAHLRRLKSNKKYKDEQDYLINRLSQEDRLLFYNHQTFFHSKDEFIKNELWVDMKGWENIYSISCFGRIRNKITNKIKTPHLHHSGYFTTSLHNGTNTTYAIYSRLIAINFKQNDISLPEVNHINRIRIDNRLSNLEWSTSKENSKHRIDNSDYSSLIPIIQMDLNGVKIKEWDSISEAARSVSKPSGNIVSVLKGRLNYAYGFKWAYKIAK